LSGNGAHKAADDTNGVAVRRAPDGAKCRSASLTGSHGGASGRYDRFREIAFDYAFLLTQLGIRE
jgi:hypothetical protein